MPLEAERFFYDIGVKTNKVKNAMVIGGGSMAWYLTKILLNSGVDVKLIERSKKRCEELVEAFPDATVTCGDGSDQTLLREEPV